MKPSEILREAARLVEDGVTGFGCIAINITCQHSYSTNHNKAIEYFKTLKPSWALGTSGWFGDVKPKNQDRRVVALCLAAAIAESEGQ